MSLPLHRLALVGHVDPNKLPKPLTPLCAICGADETVMVEIDFRYTPRGVLLFTHVFLFLIIGGHGFSHPLVRCLGV